MDWLSSGPFGLLSLAFCQLTGFGRFFGHPSIFGFCCFFAMVLECVKTCVIHASELVASYEKARVIELLRECLDFEELSAIQFCPRGLIRVTFKDAADKEDFVRVGSLTLDGHDLSVTSSDKPYSFVYVHYFPVEGDDALIRDELGKYGEVINIKHQSFSGIPGLLTGSRVLTMVLSDPVPAEFRIDDYPVRVWYKGIPPFCQICKISGHKAADCQFNGKCRRCGSPDHKAHACTRPWGQSVVPMEVAVPVVVPDPPETIVPAVSDSSVEIVADKEDEAVVKDDEVADKENLAVVEEDVGPPGPPPNVLSPVASSRFLSPERRRWFSSWHREMLCRRSGDAMLVFSEGNNKVCGVFPADDPMEVRITYEDGTSSVVHANLVSITDADISDRESAEEYAQFLLQIKDDPTYRISFRGSFVDSIGPTEHSGVLWAEFTDHVGLQCRKLPAGDLAHQKVALVNDSSGVNNGNKVNKASSPSTGANVNNGIMTPSSAVGDGIVNVSRNSSRSVVPTAAVLAAELLKRATPPSVVGVPKCRKKL